MSDVFWLSESQFLCLAPLLPTGTRGKPRVDTVRADIAMPVFGDKSHIAVDRHHGVIRRARTTDAAAQARDGQGREQEQEQEQVTKKRRGHPPSK